MTRLTYLSPKVEKRVSPIHGRGLFALEALQPGEVVAARGGYVMTRSQWSTLEPKVGVAAEIQITRDLVLAPSRADEVEGAMMHLNHSCDPNVGIEGQTVFVTMRPVEPGEELRTDYAMMDDDDWKMECNCGTARCRVTVDGRDWRRPELQRRYRGYFSAHVAKRIERTTPSAAERVNSLGQPIGPPVENWQAPEIPGQQPLSGRRCRLERLAPGRHAAPLFRGNALDAEGRNWTYLAYGPFESLESYRVWLNTVSAVSDPLFYAVVDSATGDATGVASYLRIQPELGSIEIGHINFSPKLQRTPAATEALFLMIDEAFRLGYRRCEWKCDALNRPSRAAARRLGFSFEGVFRKSVLYKGRNRDTAWYAIVDDDWPALREVFLRWLDPSNFDEAGLQAFRLSESTAPLVRRMG